MKTVDFNYYKDVGYLEVTAINNLAIIVPLMNKVDWHFQLELTRHHQFEYWIN